MTTRVNHAPSPDRNRSLSTWVGACVLLWLLLASCGAGNSARRGDGLDVSSYPKRIQTAYEVFAVRCSRCHAISRALNANISDTQHWVRYVDRMRLQAGSGINQHNAGTILQFLIYYTKQRNGQLGGATEEDPEAFIDEEGAFLDAEEPPPSPPEPATVSEPQPATAPKPEPELEPDAAPTLDGEPANEAEEPPSEIEQKGESL